MKSQWLRRFLLFIWWLSTLFLISVTVYTFVLSPETEVFHKTPRTGPENQTSVKRKRQGWTVHI